jgi:DNA-directed RNA polymerase II subunit RPB1
MPSGFNNPTSELENIIGVQFSVLSPEEIRNRSAVEITSQTTYEGSEPKIGGLFDPRMGVLDNGKVCRTCGQTNHKCPGHFGHYNLSRPVYFIQFMPAIMSVLRCICIKCSKLLIDKSMRSSINSKKGEAKWREVLNACNTIDRCGKETEDGCGAQQPNKFTREGVAHIVAHYKSINTGTFNEDGTAKFESRMHKLDVEYVHQLFRRITDEDVDFMGYSRHWSRPDWLICSVLPIPPPQVRPSVVQDNNTRSEDDLTHKLFEIIKADRTLQDKIEKNSPKQTIDEWTAILQYHVATLIDNKIPGVAPSAQRSGRPLKSVQDRIGSKEGRIRYNIQGKRVEFSARSVITPDPNISISEIGVPVEIATNLTFPEKITQFNKHKIYALVRNGADKYPGAKTIVRKDGRMISLKHVNTGEIVLYNGDVVNRHLMDGDIVLFNRQPTLHKMSMMAHRVRVLPYKTFRLNVLAVKPYNADFIINN